MAGALRCCRCLKTHADALRNLVVTRRRRKVYSELTQEEEEEEEEEEGLFKADAVNEEDPERDRATQV